MLKNQLEKTLEKIGGISLNRFVHKEDISSESFGEYCKKSLLETPYEFTELINTLGFHDFNEMIVCETIEVVPISADEKHCPIGTIYGNGKGPYSIQYLVELLSDQLSKDYLPFAEGASGDYYCMGLADFNFGEVYYRHHGSPEDEDMYLISMNIADFIKSWKIDNKKADTSGMASITDDLKPDSEFAKFLEKTSDTGWKLKKVL